MSFAQLKLPRPLYLCLGAAIGAVVVAQALRWSFPRKSSKPLPPKASCSPWDVVNQYHGVDVPSFYLKIARQLQTPAFRLPLPFGNEVYIIVGHDLATRILQDPKNDKSDLYKVFELASGGLPAIFTLPTMSSAFAPRRKAIAHAMAPVKLNKKVHFLENKLHDLFAILEMAAKDNTPVDIDRLLIQLTLDVISFTALDYELCALSGDDASEGHQFIEEFGLAAAESHKRSLDPFRKWMVLNAQVRRAKKSSAWILDLGLRIINHYRCRHTAQEIADDDSVLANIINNKDYPDDFARAADVIIMLIGGFDTTAHTLAWTLYELSCHPEVQKALQAEVDQLPDHPQLSQLNQLSMLNCCLKESMRLWPVAADGSFRQMHADLEVDGMVVPRNAIVILSFHALFRQLALEDPDEFRPERWLSPSPELEASFMPFSLGVRNCVGQNLANLELRVVLAHLMRRFSFSVAKQPVYHYVFLAKPEGLLLHVSTRV